MASAVESLMAETEAHEEAEPPVEANPKIGRSAFNYMEPRLGIDGRDYFRRCASCESFVPETAMGGAVQGARCARFGSDFRVTDDDNCNLYWPWHSGMICASVVDLNALELRKGIPGAMSPWSVGYRSKCDAKCRSCRFVDFGEPTLAGTRSAECEAYESLNEESPNIFDLVKTISPEGGCSLWQEPGEPFGPGGVMTLSRG
jgi:hypothetical protein